MSTLEERFFEEFGWMGNPTRFVKVSDFFRQEIERALDMSVSRGLRESVSPDFIKKFVSDDFIKGWEDCHEVQLNNIQTIKKEL